MLRYTILIFVGTLIPAYAVFETIGTVIDRLWIRSQMRIEEPTTD